MSPDTLIHDNNDLKGLTYFENLLPACFHAVAGYSGVSFANTVRMLHYDLENGKIIIAPDLNGVDRMIAIDSKGQLTGVGVSHFLPQFASSLDYEQYLIVSADTANTFFQLLHNLRKDTPKFELITFRSQEREYLRGADMMDRCNNIHHWSLYHVTPQNNDIPVAKLESVPVLSDNDIRTECMPERYCSFACAGLIEYSVWSLTDAAGYPIAVCSLIPYCSGQKEIKLWYCSSAEIHAHLIAHFMQKVLFLEAGPKGSAIWRVKKPNVTERSILNTGLFTCIGKEAHYHFGC